MNIPALGRGPRADLVTQAPVAPSPARRGGTPQQWALDPGTAVGLPDRPIQDLWFELRTWTWKSLAIVPTVPGASEMELAEQLIVVGVANTNRRMTLVSAEGATVADVDDVIAMVRAAEDRGERVIVVTDPVIDNPSSAPIVRAINGAILSIRLGVTDRAAVDRTIAAVNRSRVIGMVTRDH